MNPAATRRFAVLFLLSEAAGGLLWWVGLLYCPGFRPHFRADSAPDATLLAFAVGDLLLFVGAAGLSAWGLATRRSWAGSTLLIHTAATVYAALYCLSLTLLTAGEAWLGAVLMTPSLLILPVLSVCLREVPPLESPSRPVP